MAIRTIIIYCALNWWSNIYRIVSYFSLELYKVEDQKGMNTFFFMPLQKSEYHYLFISFLFFTTNQE